MGLSQPAARAELDEVRDAYAAAPGVRRIAVGGRPLIHCERRQQLYELNSTADLIWRRLSDGETRKAAARALSSAGISPSEADAFVRQALDGWLRAGQLIPSSALVELAQPARALRRVGLDELALEVAFYGAAAPEAFDAVFAHLAVPGVAPCRRLAVVGAEGLNLLFLDGAPLGAWDADAVVPEIKARLTDLYVEGVEDGFLAHGAYLTRGDRALLLSGAPGAGKTTLTTALAASGWAYGGDDIVRIDSCGEARGAPFAAAVKSGAWSLVQRYAPELADAPTRLRGDGQLVRYWLPPQLCVREPRALGAVVLLARQDGETARLEPIHPLEALCAIIDSAYSAKWRLKGAALAALGTAFEAAGCYRLVYSDLDEAVSAIGGLADV